LSASNGGATGANIALILATEPFQLGACV